MALGPIEVVVIAFPGSRFTGQVSPAIEDLVARKVIRVVDAMVVRKAADGSVTVLELEDLLDDPESGAVEAIMADHLDLLSAEDAETLTAGLVGAGAGVRAGLDESGARRGRRLRWPAARGPPGSPRGRGRGARGGRRRLRVGRKGVGMRRRYDRPGLVGTRARTAVIAGTATAVSENVAGRHAAKARQHATTD